MGSLPFLDYYETSVHPNSPNASPHCVQSTNSGKVETYPWFSSNERIAYLDADCAALKCVAYCYCIWISDYEVSQLVLILHRKTTLNIGFLRHHIRSSCPRGLEMVCSTPEPRKTPPRRFLGSSGNHSALRCHQVGDLMPHNPNFWEIRMNLSRRTASALYCCGLDVCLRTAPVPKPNVRVSYAFGSPANPNSQSLPKTS